MPPALPPPEEDAYNSASDSDFDASLSPSSGDESEASDAATTTAKKDKKRKTDADGDVDMASGDEGIVAQGRKKKRRKGKGKEKAGEGDGEVVEEGEDEEGEGGVGIRVRLRSGRGGGDETKKTVSESTGATIDIESVWARLNNPQALRPLTDTQKPPDANADAENIPPSSETLSKDKLPPSLQVSSPESTITIPHTYTFAGQTHTSTKIVPASSKEAQAYLASKDKNSTATTGPALRRPLARKGLLDPNPQCLIKGMNRPPRSDLPTSIGGQGTKHLNAATKAKVWEVGGKKKEVKLNTVEKSKLDWEAEVERQGLRDELEKAEKSGGSYLGRMEFLGRGDQLREEEARKARLKEMGIVG